MVSAICRRAESLHERGYWELSRWVPCTTSWSTRRAAQPPAP